MKIIAHGGGKGLAPENTVAAFKKALQHYVDEIEFDVRVTKDGKTALVHEPQILDRAGNRLEVATHTFEELQRHIPTLATLDDAILAINRKVPAYVEVKPGVPTGPIIEVLRPYFKKGWKPEDFRIGSYSQPVLLELQAAFPDVEKIVIENWSSWRAVRRAKQVGTKRLSMLEYWLWPGFISAMKRQGYELYSFPPKSAQKERRYARIRLTGTTNNPERAREWAKRGLAGVITDYPDRFEK